MIFFIVGLSGTGKSSIGKQLAKQLSAYFVDSDLAIEKTENQTIESIFSKHDEEYFRQKEKAFIAQINTSPAISTVVATGGGLPCYNDLMTEIKARGIVIHFTLPIKALISRLKKSHNRPLITGDIGSAIEKQFNERNEVYSRAHLTVNTLDWSAEKMKKLLVELNQINTT